MKYEQRREKTRNLGGYPISLDLLSCFPEIPTKCSFQTLGICPFRARNKVEKDFEGVIWNSLMDLSRELRMRVWVLKHVKLCSTYSSDNTRLKFLSCATSGPSSGRAWDLALLR